MAIRHHANGALAQGCPWQWIVRSLLPLCGRTHMADDPNVHRWCFIWDPSDDPKAGTSRAALVKKNKWDKNSTINIAFIDGVPVVQKRIKDVVTAWTQPDTAQLRLVFVNDPDKADVRITFKYSGSWSTIGTSCRTVPKGQASMNYGWLTPQTSDEELRRVVLHEFGHALGLIHEHQNPDPDSPIPWNKDNVYKDLSGPPNNWDRDTIDRNMFQAYAVDETNFTQVDTKSIMMYPIPARWVTDPKYVAGLNDDLSSTDKQFINKTYPK
jgi:hypothetical protein